MRENRDEARATVENTVVPRNFDGIDVPFPERGESHLAATSRALGRMLSADVQARALSTVPRLAGVCGGR